MSPVVRMCAECRRPVLEGGALHDSCRRVRVARRNAVPHRRAHRSALHFAIRRAVLRRYKACVDCGTSADPTVDYVVPLAAGGTMALSNAVRRCRSCNSSRGGGLSRGGRGIG